MAQHLLTREVILKMEAGINLNKLVAEKLLGITLYHYDKDVKSACYFMLLNAEGDPVKFYPRYRDGEHPTEADAWADCPAYSTDIAAAFQVVEKLTAEGWGHKHQVFSAAAEMPGWQWTFMRPGGGMGAGIAGAQGETAPLAICRAALLTILEAKPTVSAPSPGL